MQLRPVDDSNRQGTLSHFVTNNFTIRQCRRYVKVDWSREAPSFLLSEEQKRRHPPDLCACGRPVEWHRTHGLALRVQSPGSPGRQMSLELADEDDSRQAAANYWDASRDTSQKMCLSCFGEIRFAISEAPSVDCDSDWFAGPTFRLGAKYIRLEGRCEDDYLNRAMTLVTHRAFWNLPDPGVVVAAVGQLFLCRKDLEEDFIEDVTEMIVHANKDSIWLVTGSNNSGISHLIGKAVSRARRLRPERCVTCLGVASWASVANRDALGASSEPLSQRDKAEVTGQWPAYYDIDYSNDRSVTFCDYLEPNHDAFLLIDNGKELAANEKFLYREVAAFRSRLVDKLTEHGKIPVTSPGLADKSKTNFFSGETTAETLLQRRANFYNRTPAVILLIGGGVSALEEIRTNLVEGATTPDFEINQVKCRPVVVLTGFGGLADLLAFALTLQEPKLPASGAKLTRRQREEYAEMRMAYDLKLVSHPGFQHMLKGLSLGDERTKLEADIIIKLGQCLTSGRRNITVLDRKSSGKSIKSELVNALSQTKLYSSKKTLEVCLILNEVEGAKKLLEEVESLGLGPFQNTFEEFCSKQAAPLIFEEGLADFYRLFSTNFQYLTLRKVVSPAFFAEFYRTLSQGASTSQRIWLLFSSLLHFYEFEGTIDEFAKTSDVVPQVSAYFHYLIVNSRDNGSAEKSCRSMRDVFLTQLLLGNDALALELFKDGNDHFLVALEAACFLRRLSRLATAQTLKENYKKASKAWELRSAEILRNCSYLHHKSWPDRWVPPYQSMLLERKQRWNVANCPNALELAFRGRLDELLSCDLVRVQLVQKWHGHVDPRTPNFMIWLMTICPLFWFILVWVQFVVPKRFLVREVESIGELEWNDSHVKLRPVIAGVERPTLLCQSHQAKSKTHPRISFSTALKSLYTSPVSKFSAALTSQICFALLLSQIVTFSLSPQWVTPSEVVAWIWSFTFFCQYLRPGALVGLSTNKLLWQLTSRNAIKPLLLVFTEILLLTAAAMRLSKYSELIYPRTLYAIVCLHSWLTILAMSLPASSFLGHRAMAFVKLAVDLAFFFAVYLVVLLAFSIPLFAMVWPDSTNKAARSGREYFLVVIEAVYHQWWNLFNQIGPSEFDGTCRSIGNNQNQTQRGQLQATPCPSQNYLAIIIFLIFIIITNLLLLNALSAMFTKTLIVDCHNSDRKWLYWFHRTVKNYQNSMLLPAPVSLGQLTYEWIMHWNKRYKQKKGLWQEENEEEDDNRLSFEQSQRIRMIQRAIAKSICGSGQAQKSYADNSSAGLVKMTSELSEKLDDQVGRLTKRIGELERQQAKTLARLTARQNESLGSFFGDGSLPQSQNY